MQRGITLNAAALLRGKCPRWPQLQMGGKWSVQEDKALKKAVEEYGAASWDRIATELFLGRHNAAQCQVRWNKVREHAPRHETTLPICHLVHSIGHSERRSVPDNCDAREADAWAAGRCCRSSSPDW